jgi:ABC-type transport system involved in multi-copper enzyme maturation permease subunit
MSGPISTFCWLCAVVSLVLTVFSTVQLRLIGARTGTIPFFRRILGLQPAGATERPPRAVGKNPIAWRESVARGKTASAILARWSFVSVGVGVALAILWLYHVGTLNNSSVRLALGAVVAAEIVVIALAALNMSATAVSREREDGTLDIILTTPIQPGPYIRGKHRGLFQYLIPMMLVPVITLALFAVYVTFDGFGREGGTMLANVALRGTAQTVPSMPVVLPEGAIALPLMLGPFVAFCVMVGLHWSIKSKGTIGSVIGAVSIVLLVAGVLSLCAMPAGRTLSFLGAIMTTFSPVNLLFAIVSPETAIPSALADDVSAARITIVIGSAVSALGYAAISYFMHTNMKRTFMMTVRRLAGTS